jgi:hypothetical protein
MDTLQHRLFLKFKVNNISQPGIIGPIIFQELLEHVRFDKKTKLIDGQLHIHTAHDEGDDPEVCWHLWVEDEDTGEVFDINKIFAADKDSEFEKCEFNYYGGAVDNEPEELWTLYKKDKKEFWKSKTIPQKIKNFRAKVFKSEWRW